MATSYTGTEVEPTDITVLDDGDAPAEAAWLTATKALKDYINWLYAKQQGHTSVEQNYGSAGGAVDDSTNSTAELTIQSGGVDADLDVTSCEDGDRILVIMTAVVETSGTATTVRLKQTTLGASTIQQVKVPSGSYCPITLQGIAFPDSSGTATFTLSIQNDTATGAEYSKIYGELMFTATRMRP